MALASQLFSPVIRSFTSANQVQDWIIKTALLSLLFSRIVYTKKQKDYGYIYRGSEKLRSNITFIDRGLAKPKEARYLRMQNNFPGKEQLPTEGAIKKTRFRSYSVGGVAKKAELCTLVWFLKAVISPSVNAWLCGDDNLAWGQLQYVKKLKDPRDDV